MDEFDRRDQILKTAERMFSERGYHATSMRDLAAELNVKGSSLYSHISGKEDLLWRSLLIAARRFAFAISPFLTSDAPAAERLRGAIAAHLEVITEDLPSATVYFHEWRFLGGERREAFLKQRDEYERNLRGIVRDAVAEGAFQETLEPKWATLLILSAVNWLYQWYDPNGALSADEIADKFTEMLFHGFRQGEMALAAPTLPAKRGAT
jgi:AcrR family transcriptional regulator